MQIEWQQPAIGGGHAGDRRRAAASGELADKLQN
jgi:hypothetical protein